MSSGNKKICSAHFFQCPIFYQNGGFTSNEQTVNPPALASALSKGVVLMTYMYKAFDHKGNLLVATRNFDLALQVYASTDKCSGWPVFVWEPLQVPAIPGYPDAFLPCWTHLLFPTEKRNGGPHICTFESVCICQCRLRFCLCPGPAPGLALRQNRGAYQ